MISLRLGPGMTRFVLCRYCGRGMPGFLHAAGLIWHTACYEERFSEARDRNPFEIAGCQCERCVVYRAQKARYAEFIKGREWPKAKLEAPFRPEPDSRYDPIPKLGTPIPLHPVVERRKKPAPGIIFGHEPIRGDESLNEAKAELNRGASERMEVKILNPEKIGKIETARVQVGAEPGDRPRLTTLPPWMKANEDRIVEQWRELCRNQGQSIPAKCRASGWGRE